MLIEQADKHAALDGNKNGVSGSSTKKRAAGASADKKEATPASRPC